MSLALLTIGTGIGARSTLSEGLRTTLSQLGPRRFWLVPSAHPDSVATADLVREGFEAFASWSPDAPYRTLADHDDLDGCRRILRETIAAIRKELQTGERLVLNPTSGTKQMTAAAILAALDQGIGDIVFTTGKRTDGLVVAGTEQQTAFDPAGYFRERDLESAQELFASGAFLAAARILSRHRSALPHAVATALTCHHWRRLDYTTAVSAAATGREDLRQHLIRRAECRKSGSRSPEILADIVAWADHAKHLEDAELCVNGAYKALEYAARLAFQTRTGLVLPCHYDELSRLDLSEEWLRRAAENTRSDGIAATGVWQVLRALQYLGDSLGCGFFEDPLLCEFVFRRNESVHDTRPVNMTEAEHDLQHLNTLFATSLPGLPSVWLPTSLPEG
jgi:hypothetical protein